MMESTSATTSKDVTDLKKGPWTAAEDAILMEYVKNHGEGNWNQVQKNSGLARCGKSCRLRWANHLRPNLKKGAFSPEEERLIFELHAKLGNKWARMAAQLPGRTDNEIKNYWNTRVKRRLRQGLPLYPQDIHQGRSGMKKSFSYLHRQQGKPMIPKCPSTGSFLLSPKSPICPTLPLHLSSLPPHSSPPLSVYHNYPVSLPSSQVFTPIVTPPVLGSQFGRYKRYNRNLSLSLLSTASVTSAILGQTMPMTSVFPPTSNISSSMPMPSAQYLQDSSPLGSSESMHLACSSPFSFDPLPYSQPMQNSSAQFLEQGNLMLSTEDINNITTASELPSNQLSPNTLDLGNDNNSSSNYNDGMNMNMILNMDARNAGSGLLDDLLRQAQEMSQNKEIRKTDIFSWEQGKGLLDGLDGCWEISFSDHAATETHSERQAVKENKTEAMHMDSVSEDLSSILKDMPQMTQHYATWNSSMGDISSGQSPYPADENLGLDIQLNSVSSSNWDRMPRIY